MFTPFSASPDRPGLGSGVTAALIVATTALAVPLLLVILSLIRGNEWIAGPVADGTYAARTRAWFHARGLFPAEAEAQTMRSFSWTGTDGAFVVPLLDRTRAHQIRVKVRGASPGPGRSSQELAVSVDGLLVEKAVLTGGPQDFIIPIAPARRSRADVGFKLSHGFVPGDHDSRELGMIVDDIAIASTDGWLRVPARAWLASALAGALLGLVIAVTGGPFAWMLAAAFIAAAASAWLLNLDAAFLGDSYVWQLVRFDVGLLAVALLFAADGRLWKGSAGSAARVALTAVLVVLALRTAVFLHPSVTKGDGFFQVHRAELVHAGQYFFTSLTPRPFYEFPYAPGLYVAAMPLWTYFPSEADRLILLRTIALVVDAAAALALFVVARRFWGPHSAAIAAAVYQLVPVGLHTMCTANLTNVFGQGLFGIALLAACSSVCRMHNAAWAFAVALLLAAAFMSHFSTLSTGVPIAMAVVAGLATRADSRRAALWMAAALAVALALSYAIYYSHFHEVYARTASRILASEGQQEARSMVAPVSVKIERFIHAIRYDYYGVPLVAGGLVGIVALGVRRASDGWTRALGGWLLVVAGFFVLGILSPIEMRASLSSQPVVAALFGLGASVLWSRGAPGRLAAVALVIAVVVRGVADWLGCLGQFASR
jgi:hypothetical protein